MSWNNGIATFKAGEDLEAKRRVKIESGTTNDPPEIVYADAGEDFIGVTEYAVADGDMVAVKMNNAPGIFEIECIVDSAIGRGTVLYGAADGKVSDESSGTAQGISIEVGADGKHIRVAFWNVKSTTAATVSVDNLGAYTSEVTAEACLEEIYKSLLSAQGIIPIPMPNITDAGVALAAFSDGDSPTPGFCVTAKGLGIRWNNHGTPTPVGTKVLVPPDADVTANMTLSILAAKVGETLADAIKFTIAAYNNDVGELYDDDSDFGGDTDAMTGDATSKTVQHVTRTLALANLTAYPAAMELTIQPKDGTLGTDDVIMLAAWITYTKKLLTS